MYVGQENCTKKMGAYIGRMLTTHIQNYNNPQAFYEMVLGLQSLSWTLYDVGDIKECEYISKKYYQLLFEDSYKWVKDADRQKFMMLR